MRRITPYLAVVAVLVGVPSLTPASAATCSDYPNQAAAQAAHDTRDADGDGIYCESLPCPCSTAPAPGHGHAGGDAADEPSCEKPSGVQDISFSAKEYPHIKSHADKAIAAGWPATLVLNRPHDGERRDRLLHNIPTKRGYDRDEYPPSIGRGRANGELRGLVQGTNPTGWKADVEYVPSHENRSQGSVMGSKLRRFCNGTRFRYVWR